ncbi:MAG: hypothetical protein K6A44_03020 [bacterium]|nr:hypothetical protein [bacterium]
MKNELKILSLQFEAIDDKDKNLKKAAKMLDENSDFEPDIVVLPELWNVGIFYEKFRAQAENIPDETTMLLSGLAESYNTCIIGGSIVEKTFDGMFYNTSVVVDKSGAVVAKYRKNHLFSHCGSQENKYLNAGEGTCTFDFDGIKIGLGICYDIRFPELFRKMMKEGASVFVVPAAFPLERIEQWNILNQARALENLAILVSCNQYGSSNYISPYGKIKSSSKSGECAMRNVVDIREVIEARLNTPFLNDIKHM